MLVINNVINSLKKYQKQISDPKIKSERFKIVSSLIELLNNATSVEKLERVITTIEQIKFKNQFKEFTVYELLKKEGEACLLDTSSETKILITQTEALKKAFTSKFFTSNLHLDEILIDAHQKLSKLCSKQKENRSQKIYTQDEINGSNRFQALENTTKQPGFKEDDIITIDLVRGGVVLDLDGYTVKQDKKKAEADLEEFAGDKVADSSSKANKLFYFGGQKLQAILSNEVIKNLDVNFENANISGENISQGVTLGKIVWKNDTNGVIYAEVNMAILNFTYMDKNCNINIFFMNSDGDLTAMLDSDDEFDAIMKTLQKERNGETKDAIMPIVTAQARIELKREEEGSYYLSVVETQITYNAKEIKHHAMECENNTNNNNQCAL